MLHNSRWASMGFLHVCEILQLWLHTPLAGAETMGISPTPHSTPPHPPVYGITAMLGFTRHKSEALRRNLFASSRRWPFTDLRLLVAMLEGEQVGCGRRSERCQEGPSVIGHPGLLPDHRLKPHAKAGQGFFFFVPILK